MIYEWYPELIGLLYNGKIIYPLIDSTCVEINDEQMFALAEEWKG